MSYAMIDVEVTRPLPAAIPAGRDEGIAVLLRRKGKPIDFWMEALPQGAALAPEDLGRKIALRSRTRILHASMREELEAAAGERGRCQRSGGPAALPGGAIIASRAAEPVPFPSLSIAICTRDRPERLARLLNSLALLEPGGGAGPEVAEILVVDNAPSDGRVRDLVAALPAARGVRYAVEPRPGLDFARNRGLREANGELIAFLDDDVVADPGWLGGLAAAHSENPDAGAFTGLVLPLELSSEAQVLFELRGGFRRGFEKIRYHGAAYPGNPLYPCGAGIFGAGANMAFRRKFLLELGGFDEALDTGPPLPGGGDLDIFYRVVAGGHPLAYEPEMLVFHEHRRDMQGLRRQCYTWGLGFMAFVAKSKRSDPSAAGKFRRLIWWWFKDQARMLKRRLQGRHPLPVSMILAEVAGGVAGLLGEYGRSKRRVERIRGAAV